MIAQVPPFVKHKKAKKHRPFGRLLLLTILSAVQSAPCIGAHFIQAVIQAFFQHFISEHSPLSHLLHSFLAAVGAIAGLIDVQKQLTRRFHAIVLHFQHIQMKPMPGCIAFPIRRRVFHIGRYKRPILFPVVSDHHRKPGFRIRFQIVQRQLPHLGTFQIFQYHRATSRRWGSSESMSATTGARSPG